MLNSYQLIPDITDEYRRVPHNIEAEQALLGAILVDNRAFERVSELIAANEFFDPLHGRIFETIAGLIQSGRLASPMTLKATFENVPPLDERTTVPQYLGRLVANATTVVNAPEYAKTLRELASRRSLIIIGDDLSNSAADAGADQASTGLIEEVEGKLFELAERGASSRGGTVSFGDAAKKVVDQANRARKRGFTGLSTGLKDLDSKLGGLRRSDLIILAGRPSMGKTALAANIAWNVATGELTDDDGNIRPAPVGFFSLEMSDEQLANRLIAAETEISSSQITRGKTSDPQIGQLMEAARRLSATPLYIDDRGGITIGQLMARARRMKRAHGIELLVVDYLQLLSGTKKERVQELTQITTGLKGLAKELNIPIIALSQLSRQVESREDKRPQLSDLRESGSIEQDADVVMFVFREEYYVERTKPASPKDPKFADWQVKFSAVRGKAEVVIGKQRHGPIGIVELAFQDELTRFSDLAREAAP